MFYWVLMCIRKFVLLSQETLVLSYLFIYFGKLALSYLVLL